MRNAPLAAPSGGGAPHPRCPLWGWCSAQRIKITMIAGGNHTSVSCREAAKGVPLVFLSCFHSTNHTPSVRPFGLPAPPSGSQGIVRIRLRFHKTVSACRETPQSGPLGLPAPLSGALFSLPPLGEVPRSGKGGVGGDFERLPFNERHPLSQAVRPASSPIGEPRKPPLKGLAGVAVLDGVQPFHAGLRTAHRAGGVSGGTQNIIWNAPRRIRNGPLGSPNGGAGRPKGPD